MLQKSYLKYELRHVFGLIAGLNGDGCFVPSDPPLLATGAADRLLRWNPRAGIFLSSTPIAGETAVSVVRLAASRDGALLAVGGSDGSIRVVDERGGKNIVAVFSGHTSPVTALCFNGDGSLLASASQGTEVLVWDVLAQCGRLRFKGHKGSITSLCFAVNDSMLVSASKDTLVMVWSLTLQQCVQTLVGHRHEVWSVVASPDSLKVITGSADNKLRVWRYDDAAQTFVFYGGVNRSSEARVGCMGFCSDTRLVVQSVGKHVEVFGLADDAARRKKMRRRLKEEKKKKEVKRAQLHEQAGVPGFDLEAELAALELRYEPAAKASDEISAKYSFTVAHRLSRMAVTSGNTVALLSNRNEFAIYRIGSSEAREVLGVNLPGHRSDVRSLALNSNDTLLFSTSDSSAKIWDVDTRQCLSTVALSGSALCCAFLPLDRHVVVGTKEGKLELVNVASSSVIETVDAHASGVWDVKVAPNRRGLVSGSADKRDGEGDAGELRLQLSKSLDMSDDVMSLCFSPDGKLLAVALLDSTIKVYFTDSHKLYLTLYGHKLPVLSISISSDSRLLVSGSADKNVKIWGLDFGDVHKSLFAHEDSVTRVQFVAETHYFLSCGKDGSIKYWDADSFEHVSTLRAAKSEIWSLGVSSLGDFFVVGSADRALRLFSQTEELLFPESERQKDLEALFAPSMQELQAAVALREQPAELEFTAEGVAGLNPEPSSVALPTVASAKHAERLAEAIELAHAEQEKLDEWKMATTNAQVVMDAAEREAKRRRNEPLLPPPDVNPLLLGKSPEDYLADVLFRIPLSELESCLSLLSFSLAAQLLAFVRAWLASNSTNPETTARVAFFLVRTHLRELAAAKKHRALLETLQPLCRSRLEELRATLGFTVAGATHVQRLLKADASAAEFFAAAKVFQEREKKKKAKEATRRIIY